MNDKRKGGRPIKSKPLNQRLRIRMSESDINRCTENANRANLSLSEYVRGILVDGRVTNLFSEQEQKDKIQLIGMANNLNQLTQLAHTYSLPNLAKEAREVLNAIRNLLDRYHTK